jgi:hypothetical protein
MLYFQGRGVFQLQRRFEMPQLKYILMQIVPAHIPSMPQPRVCRRGTHTDGRDTQIQVRLGLDFFWISLNPLHFFPFLCTDVT